MENKTIAKQFQLLGQIMELHGENPFKIRSYSNAYRTIRNLEQPLSTLSDQEIKSIKGIGKAISEKIQSLLQTGQMPTLERYIAQTPKGIVEMLQIKGFGPKKIRTIWRDLGIESVGELLYACNENRLVELKGFGAKTQETLRKQLEYYQKSRHLFHYAVLEEEANDLVEKLQQKLPDTPIALTGAIRRKKNTLDAIEILIGAEESEVQLGELHELAKLYYCQPQSFGSKLFRYTANTDFLKAFVASYPDIDFTNLETEQAVFDKVGLPFIVPELRETAWSLDLAKANKLPTLIETEAIKGILHVHTTYSDGSNTLADMTAYVQSLGYEYIGITDHSKSAFYANGLKPERVLEQLAEIDQLNEQLAPFTIFKGIESDILSDGSLDYEADILAQFDFIIASVHSNLKMDKAKATERLIKAIENPYTRILGHPTGRLLLSREGYPIDYQKVIDACAANQVVIELNANPYRLDLDWSHIPYALEKGVQIAINPDAHSKSGVHDVHYGVQSARKGGLSAADCLNTKDLTAFQKWIDKL